MFWIPSGETDEFSRIPTHSGLTVEKPTHVVAPEGALATNWDYTLSDNNIVILNYYIGSEENVIVYGSYPYNGKTYKTRLASKPKGEIWDYMFNGSNERRANCRNIKTIVFSNKIDTSNVTYMAYMFAYCTSLTTLDLSTFNTAKVTSMACMFYGCSNLKTLDLSKFDTSQVTTMWGMFSMCKKLTTLNVSKFDTSQVTDMSSMFNMCTTLKLLDVSNFNTSKVQNMRGMFAYCTELTTLKLPERWVIKSGGDTYMLFHECKKLSSQPQPKYIP